MAVLNDNFLRRIPAEDRAKLGANAHRNAFRTADEITAANEVKIERTLHEQVMAFCAREGLRYVNARMDKRSTIRKGWPDFTVFRQFGILHDGGDGPQRRVLTLAALLELKAKSGRLSEAQKAVIEELAGAGITVHVCRSYQAALTALRLELLL